METDTPNLFPDTSERLVVKIIGVGNAGITLLDSLAIPEFAAAEFLAVNTDAASLAASPATVKLHLENKLLRGLGSGGDPERACALAEEQFSTIKSACTGANVVLVLAGLGGGAGSGISPVVAKAAREAGALVLAFVSLPFDCEGNRREQQAQSALEKLKNAADGVICLPGQKVFKLVDENTSVVDTFKFTSNFLIEGLRGVWQLVMRTGLIQVHFQDLCNLLKGRHAENLFAYVEAAGAGRSREVAEKILAHPLLDEGRALADADTVLVSLMAGKDLTMAEVNRVMDQVKRQCPQAQLIMGAAVDAAWQTRLAVTVIAAKQTNVASSQPTRVEARAMTPGAPAKSEVIIGRTTRSRRGGNKAVQTQLPLTIVSKGRFDKSEPTLHHGEDLDVPTFLRRGVPLN